MKIFKYLAALVHKHIWRKTQKRSDVQKNDSDMTVIAVGNGGYNIAQDLIPMGCFYGAKFFICDTESDDLTRHATNADETFLLDRINGDVKSCRYYPCRSYYKENVSKYHFSRSFRWLNRCSTYGARGCHARPICIFNCHLAIK